ncbi:MAG: LLM class flavin-dependent oxidoreductase [Alphaproteobacteria bacterium]|nr:LLM class flavin-dependent oxidoreductase [Alphaproteobacteria bacterium]
MEFSYFLSTYMPDGAYGGKRLYADVIEQAVTADRLGYAAVSIPEHHLINITMVPSPLQMAVKIASLTRKVRLTTAVVVLPVRDMRVLAGEIVQAHILCDERLEIGVGRGAYPYETGRLGVPLAATRAKFDESFAVLEALLDQEEVSWNGEHYRFESLTVMPRPASKISFVIAASTPEGVYHAARRGYDVMTTPLSAAHERLVEQVDAFRRGNAEAGAAGRGRRLQLQRGIYVARDEADAREKVALAHEYYKRFDNIKGPGAVKNGLVEPLPRKQSVEDLGKNLLICPAAELIDRLSVYADLGIDEVIAPCGYGQRHDETIDMMHRFAQDVLPHFKKPPRVGAAASD